MNRRVFVAHGVLAIAAAALAACSADVAGPPAAISASIQVANYPTLASIGGVALVNLNGAALAIVRSGASTFSALSRSCPHQGATVNQTGAGFTCPRHGARFDLIGAWTGGQRTSGLRSYPTQYNATTDTLSIG